MWHEIEVFWNTCVHKEVRATYDSKNISLVGEDGKW